MGLELGNCDFWIERLDRRETIHWGCLDCSGALCWLSCIWALYLEQMKIHKNMTSVSLKPREEEKLLRLYFPADKLLNHWGVEGDNMERHSTKSHSWEKAQDRKLSLEYLGTSLRDCLTSSQLLLNGWTWKGVGGSVLREGTGKAVLWKPKPGVFSSRGTAVLEPFTWPVLCGWQKLHSSLFICFFLITFDSLSVCRGENTFSPKIKMIWKVQVYPELI